MGTSSKRQLRVVACALVQDEKVLIVQRPNGDVGAGLWEFPGGKIETNETAQGALVREIQEELSIEIQPLHDLGWITHEYEKAIIDLNLWTARQTGGTLVLNEHQALQWRRPEDLQPEMMPEADRPFIPKLQTFLKA